MGKGSGEQGEGRTNDAIDLKFQGLGKDIDVHGEEEEEEGEVRTTTSITPEMEMEYVELLKKLSPTVVNQLFREMCAARLCSMYMSDGMLLREILDEFPTESIVHEFPTEAVIQCLLFIFDAGMLVALRLRRLAPRPRPPRPGCRWMRADAKMALQAMAD